jgi:hypothetical protein
MDVNATVGRPLVVLETAIMRGTQAGNDSAWFGYPARDAEGWIAVEGDWTKIAPVRTVIQEHVEKRSIQRADIVIGAPFLREEVTPEHLAQALARALGARTVAHLSKLYR